MEIQIKRTVKAGNSSAVILPRSWLNKEVRVEILKKTNEIIFSEVIDITMKYIDLKDIISIYLTGSYARGEEDENSDIDILIITNNVDKEMINKGIYNIFIISSELLIQKLESDLFPIGQMLKEGKPLLNSNYLDSMRIRVTKKNINWYIKTTYDKLNIIRHVIDIAENKKIKYLNSQIAYTLVLRIRTLYIINRLIRNKNYSKKEFIKTIRNITQGTNAYERYLAIKNNIKEKKEITLEETKKMYEYLKNQLENIKTLV